MAEAAPTYRLVPCPRWLHRWSVGDPRLLFVLLALGAVVTSFRVGMADPVWPTRPWHLLPIDWQSRAAVPDRARPPARRLPSARSSRCWPWLVATSRSRPCVDRRVAIVGSGDVRPTARLVHGRVVDARVRRRLGPIDWTAAAGPTLAALSAWRSSSPSLAAGGSGRGPRCSAVACWSGHGAGHLGGLRVTQRPRRTDLACSTALFAQVVAAHARHRRRLDARRLGDGIASTPGSFACGDVDVGPAFTCRSSPGVVLRHYGLAARPRLHLLACVRSCWPSPCLSGPAGRGSADLVPRRVLRVAVQSWSGCRSSLGVEAWMMRFADGFAVPRCIRH